MNCNEIRELISSMLDHELSTEDSAVVTEHLANCPECMRVSEAFHAISVSLEELEDVPEGFTEAVMHKINTPARTKNPKFGYWRIAGLAACVALVLFTGSRITTDHLHIGNYNVQDTAQHTRIIHQTPKPTPTPAPAIASDISIISSTDSTPVADFELPDGSAAKTVNNITQEATPTATPQPTPVAAPASLNTFRDLLYPVEVADFSLFTEQPNYELTVQDEHGNDVKLLIWLDGERIYCKNLVEGTAWYAVGTAETLTAMVTGSAAISSSTSS